MNQQETLFITEVPCDEEMRRSLLLDLPHGKARAQLNTFSITP